MKAHYDFSKGERGKFFFGNEPYDVVMQVDRSDGKYHFRLADKRGTLFTSEEGFEPQDDCLSAISIIKQESILAPAVSPLSSAATAPFPWLTQPGMACEGDGVVFLEGRGGHSLASLYRREGKTGGKEGGHREKRICGLQIPVGLA